MKKLYLKRYSRWIVVNPFVHITNEMLDILTRLQKKYKLQFYEKELKLGMTQRTDCEISLKNNLQSQHATSDTPPSAGNK